MRLLWVSAVREPEAAPVIAKRMGGTVEMAVGAAEGLARMREGAFDAVLVQFPLPDWTAEDFLEETQRTNSLLPVIVQSPKGALADAVRLTKLGAYHFFGSDAMPDEIAAVFQVAVEFRRTRELALFGAGISPELWRKFLIGESAPMLDGALRKSNGNKTLPAELLRLKRTTLAAKLRSLKPAAATIQEPRGRGDVAET